MNGSPLQFLVTALAWVALPVFIAEVRVSVAPSEITIAPMLAVQVSWFRLARMVAPVSTTVTLTGVPSGLVSIRIAFASAMSFLRSTWNAAFALATFVGSN